MWWPLTNRVPWKTNDTPVGFGDLWFSKRGTKGVVVVLVVRASVNDCVCAHDAHDFSIDFFGKPMPS